MAEINRGVAVDADRTNLVTALTLAEGTLYVLQNKSQYRLFLVSAAGAPTPGSDSATLKEQFVEPNKTARVRYDGANAIYAWYKGNGHGVVSVAEAP